MKEQFLKKKPIVKKNGGNGNLWHLAVQGEGIDERCDLGVFKQNINRE